MKSIVWQTSLRDLLHVAFKRKWSAAIIFAGGLFGVLFWMFFIRDELYQATAKILVKIGHEQAAPSTAGTSPVLITGERMQDVNSEVDILRSTDLHQAFVDELGLDKPAPPKPPPPGVVARLRYEIKRVVRWVKDAKEAVFIQVGLQERLSPREKAIEAVRQRLEVVPERNSNVISVSLSLESRQDAAVLLNTLLNDYLKFRLKVYRQLGAEEFLSHEVDERSKRLRQAEQEVRAFEEQWNISALQKQKEVLLEQIAKNQQAVTDAEIELNESAARLRRAEKESKTQEPDVAAIGVFPANSFPASLLSQLATLEREREHLRMTEADSSLRIQNNRQQFRVLMGMVTTHLRSALTENQSILDKRRQSLGDLQNSLKTLQDRDTEWNALRRKAAIAQDGFLTYRKRMEDVSATGSLEEHRIGNVAIISRAIDPVAPMGMPKFRILSLTLLLLVFASVAWLSIAEYLDHRVYAAEDLTGSLAAPVIDVFPATKPDKAMNGSGPTLPREAGHRIAAALTATNGSGSPRTVAFTSAALGEGVTTAVLAVSQQLGQSGGRILVLELNGESPELTKSLGLSADLTLDNWRTGTATADQCIQKHASGVSFLMSGSGPALDSASLARLVEEVRPRFDAVLVDAPVALSPQAAPIFDVVKNTVLVIESGRTRQEAIRRIREEMEAKGVVITGAILNKHQRYIPGWVYRWLLQ